MLCYLFTLKDCYTTCELISIIRILLTSFYCYKYLIEIIKRYYNEFVIYPPPLYSEKKCFWQVNKSENFSPSLKIPAITTEYSFSFAFSDFKYQTARETDNVTEMFDLIVSQIGQRLLLNVILFLLKLSSTYFNLS